MSKVDILGSAEHGSDDGHGPNWTQVSGKNFGVKLS